MKIFEWLDPRGQGVVSGWRLQKNQRARLDAKLDMLVHAEVDRVTKQANLPPNLLAGPGYEGEPFIYKLKARGDLQLRPMLCLGPFNDDEWTILVASIEKQGQLIPGDAPKIAELRRQEIIADKKRRELLVDDDD